MSVRKSAQQLIDTFRSRPTIRAGSLIVTVFGDTVAPRGGTIWVGSLIQVMAPFGVGERLVRTSVFRLSGEDWLESTSVGRKSYYGLTKDGARRLHDAAQRIYREPRPAWSGEWTIVLLDGVATPRRDELRRELGWLGFGSVSANVMVHPAADGAELSGLMERTEAGADIVVLSGRSAGARQDQQMRQLAQKSWDLEAVDERYRGFLDTFRPVYRAADAARDIRPEDAFHLRTLLIHEYRKAVLRDPLLPVDLLPEGWHGSSAYRLCRNLYRLLYEAADRYVSASMETAEGPIPPPQSDYYRRFGGLE
ncbi:MAG: phenylacetic acid degradation operon negative regulatory protein PaaX [Woeseiaceae bacterium]|nr:phenylacetic acid degradation operon negative regulatory protein PaaX [Woeseiaceae bacterium]